MKSDLSTIKGLHPGFFLERELKRRKLRKGQFAISLQEYPQTLVSIMKGKRRMNTALALKIEKVLGLEEGCLMMMQVFYDIKLEKRKLQSDQPDMSKLRPALFWDTLPDIINWTEQKHAVIKRVFERGNDEEKNEIIRFYGYETVNNSLNEP
jgi:plasmid maintenance system antidote protein VapI